jgi:hypothetical protein
MKKIIIPIVCFGLGLLLYHLFFAKKSSAMTFGTVSESAGAQTFMRANRIPRDTAKILIRGFQNNHHELETSTGKRLKGFFVDAASVRSILDQEGCNGIRIYFGLHHKNIYGAKKMYTLILIGTRQDPERNGRNLDLEGDEIYEYVDPCPDNCDDTEGALDNIP